MYNSSQREKEYLNNSDFKFEYEETNVENGFAAIDYKNEADKPKELDNGNENINELLNNENSLEIQDEGKHQLPNKFLPPQLDNSKKDQIDELHPNENIDAEEISKETSDNIFHSSLECNGCEQEKPEWFCDDCNEQLCKDCWGNVHIHKKKKKLKKIVIDKNIPKNIEVSNETIHLEVKQQQNIKIQEKLIPKKKEKRQPEIPQQAIIDQQEGINLEKEEKVQQKNEKQNEIDKKDDPELCMLCSDNRATTVCMVCEEQKMCDECNEAWHQYPSRRKHRSIEIEEYWEQERKAQQIKERSKILEYFNNCTEDKSRDDVEVNATKVIQCLCTLKKIIASFIRKAEHKMAKMVYEWIAYHLAEENYLFCCQWSVEEFVFPSKKGIIHSPINYLQSITPTALKDDLRLHTEFCYTSLQIFQQRMEIITQKDKIYFPILLYLRELIDEQKCDIDGFVVKENIKLSIEMEQSVNQRKFGLQNKVDRR